MKLNFRRDTANRTSRTLSEKLLEGARNLHLDELLKRLRGSPEDAALLGFSGRLEDQKTKPEGSKGLSAVEEINPNGVLVVRFSDGSSYRDYDKMKDSDPVKRVFDKGLESGQFQFKTIYKPDGSTFRAVDIVPQSAPKANFAAAPTPAPTFG